MKNVPLSMRLAWSRGKMTGEHRPVQRVTVHKPWRTGIDGYSAFVLGGDTGPRRSESIVGTEYSWRTRPLELPTVKSVSWDRSVETDAGTCQVTIYNKRPNGTGNLREDARGYYTFSRGFTEFQWEQWQQRRNEFEAMLVPDNVLRTFEGYGVDWTVGPEDDPHMVLSGTWLIDDVTISPTTGLITLECRDMARLLMDQLAYPPVISFGEYPTALTFEPQRYEDGTPLPPTIEARRAGLAVDDSSSWPYTGDKRPKDSENAAIYGHRPSDAFDDDPATYWLSIGNARRSDPYSYEWLQGTLPGPVTLSRLKMATIGAGYTMFFSVWADGGWKGTHRVPYDPNHPTSAPNGANIPYVKSFTVGDEQLRDYDFDPIPNATAVRVTFTNLWNSRTGKYPYRAGVRTLQAWATTTVNKTEAPRLVGNYSDYADIVKRVCGWAGFYWRRGENTWRTTANNVHTLDLPPFFPTNEQSLIQVLDGDPALPGQRGGWIWGDIEPAYTAGETALHYSQFDRQPLMSIVTAVRDILGYVFYVDEAGGVVFRLPNIFTPGNTRASHEGVWTAGGRWHPLGQRNWRSPTSGRSMSLPQLGEIVTIDESQQLLDIGVKLSSRNTREQVIVFNPVGSGGGEAFGAVSAGWVVNNVNLQRVGGYPENWEPEDVQRAADMITIRQLMTYRENTVTIPGYSRIQIDDQVRIFERTTAETYLHWVKGISSQWDVESGEWTYTLTTCWLGAQDQWIFDAKQLTDSVRDWLSTVGKV